MKESAYFTASERAMLVTLYRSLLRSVGESLQPKDGRWLKQHLVKAVCEEALPRDNFGLNPIIKDMQTALIVVDEMGMRRASVMAIMLHGCVQRGALDVEEVKREFGEDVATIIHGLVRINQLYEKSPAIESENFRNLLLSFAEDMRVVLIMIADRVNLMRQIRDVEDEEGRLRVANEAAYLYAPLAHKLGLYKLKSELEDLSLKYTEKEMYYHIREKLNATKETRDRYIASFIGPIEQKLKEAGLHFHIKGRTKSIHSIYQKMKKQKTTFEGIYDLFAIRVILDSEVEREKMECWQVYSIVTDMYQPNPKRLRDWLSVPKSNGYESLHITVLGPDNTWVEVQIRTERMDAIAERGLAAHWRYKGVKGESGLDEWLTSIREALEHSDGDDLKMMDQFKMDLYEDEVYVFTPKGDLFKLAKGATVLDFAFHIHTNVGSKCVGGRINGKNVTIRQKLNSGDTVEILTSNSQTPKAGWLEIAATSRARTKIRQALKEISSRQAEFGKETFERKLKNRKLDYDEPVMMHLIKKMGFKEVNPFYQAIADEQLDINDVVERYVAQLKYETDPLQRAAEEGPARSAEGFNLRPDEELQSRQNFNSDVLVIDRGLKGIDFTLAKCCNPIYGDDVFGFVTSGGGIKVHRTDCPNAPQLRERFGYRIVKARWAGKNAGSQYEIRLRVVGHDDIGIVNNITSIISKEQHLMLRNISIDSYDGLFSGTLTVMVDDTSKLEQLIKKIRTVKGVKQVSRC